MAIIKKLQRCYSIVGEIKKHVGIILWVYLILNAIALSISRILKRTPMLDFISWTLAGLILVPVACIGLYRLGKAIRKTWIANGPFLFSSRRIADIVQSYNDVLRKEPTAVFAQHVMPEQWMLYALHETVVPYIHSKGQWGKFFRLCERKGIDHPFKQDGKYMGLWGPMELFHTVNKERLNLLTPKDFSYILTGSRGPIVT